MNQMPTSTDLRSQARESLAGNWGNAVLAIVVYSVIVTIIQLIPDIGEYLIIFVQGSFTFGLALYFLNMVRKNTPPISALFEGFRIYGKTLLLSLLISIFIFLWMLLLIVPGIIAILRYSQAYYILIDNPDIGVMEAIERSKQMMVGQKMNLFVLYLSFIGWFLLSILTCFIGLLWLSPYVATTQALFYENLRGRNTQVG